MYEQVSANSVSNYISIRRPEPGPELRWEVQKGWVYLLDRGLAAPGAPEGGRRRRGMRSNATTTKQSEGHSGASGSG